MTLAFPKRKPPPEKPKRKPWPANVSREIEERSGGICEAHRIPERYGLPKSCTRKAGDKDHIRPSTFGGPSTAENGAHLCDPCHDLKTLIDNREAKKSNRIRLEAGQQSKRGKVGWPSQKIPQPPVSKLSKRHPYYRKGKI
tara:strand:- start:1058 stop:1480 length:423 start_codon:yes stop_codon:yes gene_type:complete